MSCLHCFFSIFSIIFIGLCHWLDYKFVRFNEVTRLYGVLICILICTIFINYNA